jgi:hypothetical protein
MYVVNDLPAVIKASGLHIDEWKTGENKAKKGEERFALFEKANQVKTDLYLKGKLR